MALHPFPNDNGRHARVVADIFLRESGQPLLTWGARILREKNPDRDAYIKALKKADEGDFEDLIRFAIS